MLTNGESGSLICENVHIEGFKVGITIPRRGVNSVSGGLMKNHHNLIVQEAVEPNREITISGVEFSPAKGGDREQFDVVMLGRGDWLMNPRRFLSRWHADELANLPMQFANDTVHLNGHRVFFNQQSPNGPPARGSCGWFDRSNQQQAAFR